MAVVELNAQEMDKLLSFLTAEVAESPRLEAWINGALLRVSRCYFGKAFIYALSLMVMHKAAMEAQASEGVAGPATQKREGDISVSYASGNGASATGDLGSTSYGIEYQTLLEQYSPRPGVTGGVMCMGLDGGDRIQSCL